MNVSLRVLRAFLVACDEEHVGRAAAKLFISQPALSQDIRKLERALGFDLFFRGPKGLTLTPAGQEFERGVRAGLAVMDHGLSSARDLATGKRPTVRIAYSPSVGNRLMPVLLPALERRIASLDFDEREVDTGDVGPGILNGRYDYGIAHCPAPDLGLALVHLADEPLCAAVSSDHRLADRTTIDLSELSGSSLLIWPRVTAPEYYDEIVGVCTRAGLLIGQVREFRRAMTRSYLLADGNTFSLLPRSAARIAHPDVTFIELEPACSVPLFFLRRADDTRLESHAIADFCRSVCDDIGISRDLPTAAGSLHPRG